MLFRKAETREAEAIRALYQAVIGTPFCTWDESYPGETEIAGDLSAGTLYVLEEDHQVIGAISIVPENELDHFNCWALKENAREFARVVIKSDQQHKGLSVYLVEGVIRELQRQGVAAIHIAVAKENIPAQKLYRKTGFDFCGEADMYGHSYFLCERSIEICSVKENDDHDPCHILAGIASRFLCTGLRRKTYAGAATGIPAKQDEKRLKSLYASG